MTPTVRLNQPYRLHHPWIFSRAVVKPTDRIPPGSIVRVEGPDGQFVGHGFYNGHGRIGVRLLSLDPSEVIDAKFFAGRIGQAISWRQELGLLGASSAVRLVHSEGDGLSGLIVDLYSNILAVQFVAAGMFRQREVIKAALLEHFPEAQVYWFAEERIQKQESFDCWAMPPPAPVVVQENGVRFHVAVGSKHKTGFFADQRDNRRLLAEHCRGKDVLDLCCHTAGFALFAKVVGGARQVTAVDLDETEALPIARANAALNGATLDIIGADAATFLRTQARAGARYDVVILDPAKQTRSAQHVEAALRDYQTLNSLAMAVVRPGGILLTCSCSGLVSEDMFLGAVRAAARDAGRDLQVFRLSGAGADHPFLAHVPETRYLKAIWGRVL